MAGRFRGPSTGGNWHGFHVDLPPEDYDRARTYADREGLSVAQVVRLALRRFLDGGVVPPPGRRK